MALADAEGLRRIRRLVAIDGATREVERMTPAGIQARGEAAMKRAFKR